MQKISRCFFLLASAISFCANANPFTDDFGIASTRQASSYVPQFSANGGTSYYKFADPAAPAGPTQTQQRVIDDGYYTVLNPNAVLTSGGGAWWQNGTTGSASNYQDHTGNGGAVLIVNAGNVQNAVYRRVVSLQAGTKYTAKVWRFIIAGPTNLSFDIRQADDSASVGQSPNYTTATGTNGTWSEMSWTFTTGGTCGTAQYAFSLLNNSQVVSGNDLFFDDISVQPDPTGTPSGTLACSTTSTPTVTALPDSINTGPGQAVTISPLANDTITPNGSAVGDPTQGQIRAAHGTVNFTGTGTVIYTPTAGYVGPDTFSYQICTTASAANPTPICSTANVNITVAVATAVTKSIPTLSEWGLILMASVVGLIAMLRMRKQR
ncbi:IPTL-CTERM sorting domain-containing protein [Xylophilus sp. Leaf220]|uniref:IPTL-CTERM sorting domain-containing protein n=1 Tax=Xylophilus sp. Leaf220 TaxID=1735686 RepID=UPI0009EA4B96|nr:IPTL-CTERM sorting domain-containing protein [Xylophilus sp. Leaf220]